MRQTDFDSSFGPEKLTSYEIGWKSELLDRRLRFNGAIFYSDYRDIQLDILVPNQPDPTLTQTTNAGKASVYGVEAELDWLIADPLRLSLSYGYLENDIKEVEGDDPDLWSLPNAPKNSATATLAWDIAQLSFGALNFTIDSSYRDDSTPPRARGPATASPSYSLTNLQLSLEGEDWVGTNTRMRITAWMRNVFDEEYYSDTFGSFAGVHAQKVSTYGPRNLWRRRELQVLSRGSGLVRPRYGKSRCRLRSPNPSTVHVPLDELPGAVETSNEHVLVRRRR